MRMHSLRRASVALLLCVTCAPLLADALSQLPERWQEQLIPVEEADISGAERLMREAIAEARQEIARLLTAEKAEPTDLAGAYGRLGALLLMLEVEASADACLRNAGTLQPDEFRWPYYAGYLAMMAGRTDRALDYLETARDLDPEYPPLYLRLGKVWLDRNELADARAAFERIHEAPGLESASSYHLGQIANLERRFEDAVRYLEQALKLNPEATEVHYPLAQAYRALGRNELAREHLGRFRLRLPEAKDPLLEQMQGAIKRSLPAFKKAIDATRRGDYTAAVTRFEEGLGVDPDNVPARVSYARTLYLSGRVDDAAKELTAALEVQPDQVLASFLQAVLLQQQGDSDGAARQYRHTLALEPGHAGALFYLANLDFAAGRFGEAAAGYRAALAASHDIPPARLLGLIASSWAGEPEAEIATRLEHLQTEHPQDPQLRYAQARLLAAAADPSLRDPERALKIAGELWMLQPIPPHQRALALAQAGAGHFEKAAETQRQALAMASWMALPTELEIMKEELAAYENGLVGTRAWPAADPLLVPPPFDPVAAFRDYPAAVPY